MNSSIPNLDEHPFVRAPNRTLISMSLPVMLSLVAEPLTGLIDTAFISRLGALSLAAVGVGSTALSSAFWAFNFLGIGTQTEVANAYGRQEIGRAAQIGAMALLLSAAIGMVLIGTVLPLSSWTLSLMGATLDTCLYRPTVFPTRKQHVPHMVFVVSIQSFTDLQISCQYHTKVNQLEDLGLCQESAIANGLSIRARVVEADDIGARRLSTTENLLREDLSVFETIEETVTIVDSQLRGDDEYDAMGPTPVDRVKTLLAKLDAVRRSKLGRYQVADAAKRTSHKFMGSVAKMFKNLPKPLEWRSFYNNDLNLLVQADQAVRKVSIQNKLTTSQTWSLVKLNKASKSQFEALVEESTTQEDENRLDGPSPRKRGLRDLVLLQFSWRRGAKGSRSQGVK